MSCPDCVSGHKHDGTPKGKMIKLHGLDTYITEPEAGRTVKGIIVIIPDAFGIEFVNNKLLADTYAAKGDYKVYLPDFMRGRSCPSYLLESMTVIMSPGNWLVKPYHIFWGACAFIPWLFFNRPVRTFPVVKKFFEAFTREEGSTLPVGVAGFCWGGKHTVLLSHEENYLDIDGSTRKPMLKAGFVGHPGFLEIPKDVEKITVPIAWAIPELDHHLKVPEVSDVITKIVENKPEEQRGQVKIYPDCHHGFCVRAQMVAGDISKQVVEAEDQAISWFNTKLGIGSSL